MMAFRHHATTYLPLTACLSVHQYLYSISYMTGDPHIPRFMAYLSFFFFKSIGTGMCAAGWYVLGSSLRAGCPFDLAACTIARGGRGGLFYMETMAVPLFRWT
jgi:hypothetical protein